MCLWPLRLLQPWSSASYTICSCCKRTTSLLFGLNDPSNSATSGPDWLIENSHGTATYENPLQKEVMVLNYGEFVNSIRMPHQKQCDFILSTNDNSCFILSELKIAKKIARMRNHRSKAKKQLLQTLYDLSNQPHLWTVITSAHIKQCSLFHQRPSVPATLTIKAPTSFHRRDLIQPESGEKKMNPAIEAYGFEYWEYTSNQHYKFS